MPKGYKTCKDCSTVISAAAKVCRECGSVQQDAHYLKTLDKRKQPGRVTKANGHRAEQSDSDVSEAELNIMSSDSEGEQNEQPGVEDEGVESDEGVAGRQGCFGAQDDYPIIQQVTSKSALQPGERLDCPPFEWQVYLKDKRPMLELKAGSNVWYQATIIGESKTEIRVDFPATNKTPHVQEWISKCSSRIWRGPMGGSAWRYIKGSDGAWEPKAGAESTNAGSRKRGSAHRPRQRRSGGQGRSRDDTTGTGTHTGDTTRARALAEAAMDTAASPQQPRLAKALLRAIEHSGFHAGATASEDAAGREDSPGVPGSNGVHPGSKQLLRQQLPFETQLPPQFAQQAQQPEPRAQQRHHSHLLHSEPQAQPQQHRRDPQLQHHYHQEDFEDDWADMRAVQPAPCPATAGAASAAPAEPAAAVAPKEEPWSEEERDPMGAAGLGAGPAVAAAAAVAAPAGEAQAVPDPLAAWFLEHFGRLEAAGQLGEAALGRSAEAGGCCWPMAMRAGRADSNGEPQRSREMQAQEQHQQHAGSGTKRKDPPSGQELQHGSGGKESRELRRLRQWEWDKREELSDADSDAEVSHDDSMSGSREHAQHAQHAAADRPLLSTRPGDRLLAV